MKRFVTVILLCVIIFGTFGFVAVKIISFRNPDVRAYFAASPWMRSALGLHYDGDAAADYLGGRYSEIRVEVDSMDGFSPDSGALDLLVKKISEVTGKRATYFISDRNIPYVQQVGPEQVARLVDIYRNDPIAGERGSLYLLYASRDNLESRLLGETYQESSILVFENAVIDFTGANSATLPAYEESTALHEFGHQIGLNHDEEKSCLMAESAEESLTARQRPKDVVTDFCPEEKAQIHNLKLKL